MTKKLSMKLSALVCGAVVALVLPLGTMHAATYAEQGDAGDLPLSAQIAAGTAGTTLDHITGTLTSSAGITEGDMFEIYINSPTTFSATTTNFIPGSNNFDSQLFLFNAAGTGVYANDDDPTTGSQSSTLPSGTAMMSSLPAGVYYLLITGSGRYPIDSLNHLIFPNFTDGTTDPTGVYGPNGGSGAIAGYTGNSNQGGNYSIAVTGAQFLAVPEPSALGALALGGAGLILSWRRRRAGNRNS